jgi:hypothetical protein
MKNGNLNLTYEVYIAAPTTLVIAYKSGVNECCGSSIVLLARC